MLFIFIASALAFNYESGETFSYRYSSAVTTRADEPMQEGESVTQMTTCLASFKVVRTTSIGSYIEMVVSDVATTIGIGSTSEKAQKDADSEQYYSRPIYFTHKTDGTITDVTGNTADSPDLIATKTAVLFGLQTKLNAATEGYTQTSIVDMVGTHFAYFQSAPSSDRTIVNSHFTNYDVIHYLDERTDKQNIGLESSMTQEIVGNRLVASRSQLSVIMNQPSTSNSHEDLIPIVATGTSTLSSFARGNTVKVSFPYSSAEEFVAANPEYELLPCLQPQWFTGRKHATEFTAMAEAECPGDIDFCKAWEYSWGVGNPNIGLQLKVSAVVGVKKGCLLESRSYIAGAYGDVDILVLGRTINAFKAFAEYGLMYGSPLRNKVEVSIFGYIVYTKDFPWYDCIVHSWELGKFNKDFSVAYTVLVYIVTLNFNIGVTIDLSATLTATVCLNELKASIQLLPKAAATLHGGAEASVAIAKAGVQIQGRVGDFIDPTAFVDGNMCQVGVYVYNTLEPITAALIGYYQTLTIKNWRIQWGARHEKVFWSYTWAGRKDKIFEQIWGAK